MSRKHAQARSESISKDHTQPRDIDADMRGNASQPTRRKAPAGNVFVRVTVSEEAMAKAARAGSDNLPVATDKEALLEFMAQEMDLGMSPSEVANRIQQAERLREEPTEVKALARNTLQVLIEGVFGEGMVTDRIRPLLQAALERGPGRT